MMRSPSILKTHKYPLSGTQADITTESGMQPSVMIYWLAAGTGRGTFAWLSEAFWGWLYDHQLPPVSLLLEKCSLGITACGGGEAR